MAENERIFPHDRTIVLSVFYDALDAISFSLDRSNSARGTLIVSSVCFPRLGGRIAVSPVQAGEQTLVEVFASEGDEKQSEWPAALPDKAESVLRRADCESRAAGI